MVKKRGLGRGLDALLGASQTAAQEDDAENPAVAGHAHRLPVDVIRRGRYQPRRSFDEDRLRELADSITAQGMVQPIVVRPVGDRQYEIIAGERRWRAAQIAGLADVPVVIYEVDDQSAMAMALIENIQRDDLNPLEEAGALHRLLNEFDLTHQQVAQAVGKSRTTVTNLMRLLELSVADRPGLRGHLALMLALSRSMPLLLSIFMLQRGVTLQQLEERLLMIAEIVARSRNRRREREKRKRQQAIGDHNA